MSYILALIFFRCVISFPDVKATCVLYMVLCYCKAVYIVKGYRKVHRFIQAGTTYFIVYNELKFFKTFFGLTQWRTVSLPDLSIPVIYCETILNKRFTINIKILRSLLISITLKCLIDALLCLNYSCSDYSHLNYLSLSTFK